MLTVEKLIEDLKNSIETENPDSLSSVNVESRFQELEGWDSLSTLSLIAMLSEKYTIEMDAETIKKCTTIAELFNLVDGRRAS